MFNRRALKRKARRCLRRLTIWILDNWIPLCLGMVLSGALIVKMVYARGTLAVGGEWLLIPAMLAAKSFYRWITGADE